MLGFIIIISLLSTVVIILCLAFYSARIYNLTVDEKGRRIVEAHDKEGCLYYYIEKLTMLGWKRMKFKTSKNLRKIEGYDVYECEIENTSDLYRYIDFKALINNLRAFSEYNTYKIIPCLNADKLYGENSETGCYLKSGGKTYYSDSEIALKNFIDGMLLHKKGKRIVKYF